MTAIIRRYNLQYHLYADDAQLYIEFDPKIPGDASVALFKLQECIKDLKIWMTLNKLQLNEQKTEFFVTASSYNLRIRNLTNISLTIGDAIIPSSSVVRNLGVLFDSEMSMSNHVLSLSTSINFHLRNLYRIRRYIDSDTCKQAVQALIISRLDYTNSLLCNITQKNIRKLQTLQNRAARLIFNVGRREHTSPLLADLHWLPVKERIIFKILLLVFKCLNNQAPPYLSELLNVYVPPVDRNLRSSSDLPRLTPNRSHSLAGDSAFSYAAPLIWNALPLKIRQSQTVGSFKSSLKTHMFPCTQ
jgi:hypothetical protein